MVDFKPTALYIKQHKVTGLLYLGKTTNHDIEKYKGSGSYWQNHIKKHGKDKIETLWYCWFYDFDSCLECALMLSQMYDIVKSDKWANQIVEYLLNCGSLPGELHPLFGKKRPRQSMLMTGENNPAKRQDHRDNHHTKTDEWRTEQANRWKINNPMFDPEIKAKVKEKLKGPRPNSKGKAKKKTPCEHCGLHCAPHIINRFHNDNCKHKVNK